MFDTRDLADFQAAFLQTITGARPKSAAMQVYHDTWFLGLIEVLRSRFDITVMALGDEAFNAFARDYVRSHALTSGDCGTYGTTFPAFLREHRQAASLPWLSDLAVVELALDQAHHAIDAEPCDFTALLAPDEQCDLHPSVQILVVRHDIKTFHASLRETGSAEALPGALTCELLIGRNRDDDVIWLSLAPLEAQFLRLIRRHNSLFTTLDILAPNEDDLAFLQSLLARLVHSGLVISL